MNSELKSLKNRCRFLLIGENHIRTKIMPSCNISDWISDRSFKPAIQHQNPVSALNSSTSSQSFKIDNAIVEYERLRNSLIAGKISHH